MKLIFSTEHYYSLQPTSNHRSPNGRKRNWIRSQRRIRFPDNISFTFLGRYGFTSDSNEQREFVGAVHIRVSNRNIEISSICAISYLSSYRVPLSRQRIENIYNFLLISWRLQNQSNWKVQSKWKASFITIMERTSIGVDTWLSQYPL